jgi:DNA (cytosine-5)-methyltransferase 1
MITAADLFCGAGGTSTGLKQACNLLGLKLDLTAINHWDLAIETHSKNHPYTNHLCMNLDSIEPRKVFPNGLDILLASPECTHHSIARGGKPKCDQSRASAFRVTDWAQALRPKFIMVENVREFMDWGPLDDHGKPVKKLKGKIFQSWVSSLEAMGYKVKYEVLNCANYGDPTTRRRFFLLASRVGKVEFPEPTHLQPGQMKFEGQKDWIPAKDIIDWSVEGKSIFQRKKPLAEKTLDRIWAGIEKFCKEEFKPFLTMMYGTSDSVSIENPLSTITAQSVHHYLAEPFLVETSFPGNREPEDLEEPLKTQTSRQSKALAQPFILNISHSKAKAAGMIRSTNRPMPTQTTAEEFALCEPHLVHYYGGKDSNKRISGLDRPLPTQTCENRFALSKAFLVQFYGSSSVASVDNPLPTVTCKDRFGLVRTYGIDIHFRMLKPHELAAAMSFPVGYEFAGNQRDKVKQIGNAVPVSTARALCSEILKTALQKLAV